MLPLPAHVSTLISRCYLHFNLLVLYVYLLVLYIYLLVLYIYLLVLYIYLLVLSYSLLSYLLAAHCCLLGIFKKRSFIYKSIF